MATAAEHRLLRVLWFVGLLRPDVLCVQELDNLEFVRARLEALGYACGPAGAPYERLADRGARLPAAKEFKVTATLVDIERSRRTLG